MLSGADFGPELVQTLQDSLDAAWEKLVQQQPHLGLTAETREMARQVLASAILEAAASGLRDTHVMVEWATRIAADPRRWPLPNAELRTAVQ